jgi:tRNA G10  N-methylase Trm11
MVDTLEMTQLAKTVYFADYPKAATGRSGLTVPFPEALRGAFTSVAHLSSYSIRELIGYDSFAQLETDARDKETSTATYVRELLLKEVGASKDNASDYRISLQATFQGGRGSPLHEWYPYLEGYSPDFVNSIIDKFAPNAATILDPFCGSGTTALIAALRGLRGFYSEVNPVCRFIIECKLLAIRLDPKTREHLSTRLEKIAEELTVQLAKIKPDAELRRSFRATFGASEFFDSRSFENVLRLRTLADRLTTQDTQLGRFFVVAVLRSLVPGSLLIRRGDLRFRNADELKRSPPRLLDELRMSLHRVASDLHDAPLATGAAELVCSDARTLSKHLREPVDAIITSPPYLNGTNYFRNTKIELWFLRELSSKAGLRILRDAAITSGINDVTRQKTNGSEKPVAAGLKRVLRDLSQDFYDARIPLMVRAYFSEMNEVISNLGSVLKPNGIVVIDLGDSCYGPVWVPTDRILAEMMEKAGFKALDRVVLRERQSRDGRKLSQTLQVFGRANGATTTKSLGNRPSSKIEVPSGWVAFKEKLPHQLGDMAKRNWGHPLHSLCSYQGKLKPSLAHNLVSALLPKPGARLLDPFAGVGTIPFEAQLQGHLGFGFDISPAALAITRAKLEPVNVKAANALLDQLEGLFAGADAKRIDLVPISKIRFNGPLPDYFHPRTLAEIVTARKFFKDNPPDNGASALVFSAMLHILHGNRPYALSRRSHPITPFAPTGPAEYRPVMPRLREKVAKSLAAMSADKRRTGRAFFQDATQRWPEEVKDLDAIITSPPFFDSTRFHTANWMRLWFAGWEASDFQARPASFVDERQKITFEVYRPIFQQGTERLKRGGFVLIHLGKSVKCDMAVALEKVASEYLETIEVFTESVSHCESHGIRDKGTVTHHQYLLMRRA